MFGVSVFFYVGFTTAEHDEHMPENVDGNGDDCPRARCRDGQESVAG